ncbi:hypothetical protein BJ322DRAFT_128192 [Thelephora terrestris]|uniref:Cyclin N-terminal domain-containing protein n=1 Tax=Thelephora terrestris TaxID=56493 RepID=A0A9P6LDK5_9AGAM|nr:hypothetical protein BJ322DRAFT_128192 [Thelephora terrestris]
MSLHPASLISPSEHSIKLLQLLDLQIARDLIEHVVQSTAEVINFALGAPTTSASRGRTVSRTSKYSEFTQFVSDVIARAEVTVSDILVTLVYIQRARPYLSVQTEEWALHRVFLGALIVASKYTNDSTLKNIHWAMITNTFGKRDIGRIEREFLEVLDWDLAVSEADLLVVRDSLLHLLPAQHTASTVVRSETVTVSPPSSPVTSDSDSSESSHWSDEESDSDSHSTPATSPGPLTPSHAAPSPARSRSKKSVGSVLDALRHPFWHAPHHPLSLQVVA